MQALVKRINDQLQFLILVSQAISEHQSPNCRLYKYLNFTALKLAEQIFGESEVQDTVFREMFNIKTPFLVNIFSQKIVCQRATLVKQLSACYQQESLFISSRKQLVWAS